MQVAPGGRGEAERTSPSGREAPNGSQAMFPRTVRSDEPLRSPVEAGSPDTLPDRVLQATFCGPLGPPDEKADSARAKEPDRSPASGGGATVTPLPPPGQAGQTREAASSARSGGPQGLLTVVSSLGVVLGLFFVVAWVMRRTTPGHGALLPGEVVEVLGRALLASRQQVHLIRLGSKLVLVSVSPAGVEALSEVTDPEEVQQLTGLCRQGQPGSSTAMFRQVLRQFTGEHERTRLRGRGDEAGRPREMHVEESDG